MDSSLLAQSIKEWLNDIYINNKLKNIWTSGKDMHNLFCLFTSSTNIEDYTYAIFIRKLNKIELHTSYLHKDSIRGETSRKRVLIYFISPASYAPPKITRITNNTFPPLSPTATSLVADTLDPIVTPVDTRQNGNNSSICHTSEMLSFNPKVLPRSNRHTLVQNSSPEIIQVTAQSSTHTSINPFPFLTKYGIPTDLSNNNNMTIVQSILREIEMIGKTSDLFFSRYNNTVAKPFFIPSGLSSKKSFDQWEKRGRGIDSMLEFMSNEKKIRKQMIQYASLFSLPI